MKTNYFYRQLCLSCIVLMATFALGASAQSSRQIRPYSFNKKGGVLWSSTCDGNRPTHLR